MFGNDAVISLSAAFIIGVVLMPVIIPVLTRFKFGQRIREDGPLTHLKKTGTPTMGGVVILISFILGSLVFIISGQLSEGAFLVIFVTIAFGILGFVDDYIKIKKKRSLGLKAWQKFTGQIVISVLFIVYMYTRSEQAILPFALNATSVLIPFTETTMGADLGIFYAPFVLFVFLGTVNGVNFTDGLDGLNTSVTIIVTLFFCAAGIFAGNSADGALLTFPMTGALIAFLFFNSHPAKVFMGDTGSLALGGFVAAMAVYLKLPLFLPIIGFIYMAEVLSVIIQVLFFKATKGKRFFKMAPIHHHFELQGMSEPKIVTAFSLVTALLCIVCLLTALRV